MRICIKTNPYKFLKKIAEFPGLRLVQGQRMISTSGFFGTPVPNEQGVWHSQDYLCTVVLQAEDGTPANTGVRLGLIGKIASKK